MVRYLTDKEVILINAMVIKRYSPKEQIGVKDAALLDSAINRPRASAFGVDAYPDIYTKAAALFSSLVQNHAFHNANKRTGFSAMYQFLRLNGYRLTMDPISAEEFTVRVVNEKPPIQDVAQFIKKESEQYN